MGRVPMGSSVLGMFLRRTNMDEEGIEVEHFQKRVDTPQD